MKMKDRVIRTTQQKGFKLFIQEKAQWMLFKLDMLIKSRLEYIVLYMRVYTANYDFTPPICFDKAIEMLSITLYTPFNAKGV